MFVACNLPAGFMHEHDGVTFRLNGAHVGIDDPENLPKNGALNNSRDCEFGYGITELKDADEKAFMNWIDSEPGPLKGPDGKELQNPFAPIATGSIQWNASRAELVKSISKTEGMAIGGLTEKDLPDGVTRADDPKKK
jgi:hypothetical protein